MNTVTFKTDNLWSLVSFMNENERKSLVIDGIPIDMQKQVIITMSCKGGLETIGTFEEALNKRMRMLNRWPMKSSEKSETQRSEAADLG